MLCPSRIHLFEEGKTLDLLILCERKKKSKIQLGSLILIGFVVVLSSEGVIFPVLYPRLNSQRCL